MRRLIGPALAAPVTLWLLLAFAAPFAVVVLLSLQEFPDPFAPLSLAPSVAQFATIVGDAFYLRVIGRDRWRSAPDVTALTVLLGYPLALWLARMPPRWRPLAFAVILIPLLTNVVVRSLGIVLLLAPDGLINQALGARRPAAVRAACSTPTAPSRIALAQVFMPFLVLALYDVLQGTSPRVHEAAESLGASRADALPHRRSAAVAAGPARRHRDRLPDVVDRLCLRHAARRQEGLDHRHAGLAGGAAEPQRAARGGARADDDRDQHRCSPSPSAVVVGG